MRTSSAFAFTALALTAVQGVAATGWRNQKSYCVPKNNENQCTEDEGKGFDWKDLQDGAFDSYKDYNFSGWKCGTKRGKRSLEGRSFNDRCISAEVEEEEFSNEIRCDKKDFSIGEIDVSLDDDEQDVEFHYEMKDGTTCKKIARCGPGGTTVKNDQCGGATKVKVRLPKDKKGGKKKKKCAVNFHSVKFECGTSMTSVPVPTSTVPFNDDCRLPDYCQGQIGYGYGCELPDHCPKPTPSMPSVATTEASTTAVPLSSIPVPSGPASSSGRASSSSPVSSGAPSSSAPESVITSAPASSPEPSSSAITITSVPPAVPPPPPSGTGSISLPPAGGYWNISMPAPPASHPPLPSASTPAGPPPAAECPDLLPKCLNTWLFITPCTDNANPTCYCPHADFIQKVEDCLWSYSADDAEVTKTIEYLLGICQKHIPENPAIVDCIPPVVDFPEFTPIPNVPQETLTRTFTTVVPCEPTTLTDGPSSGVVVSSTTEVVSQTLTVPAVTLVVTATEAELVYPTLPPAHVPSATKTQEDDDECETEAPEVPAGPTTMATVPGVAAPSGTGGVVPPVGNGTFTPPQQPDYDNAAAAREVLGVVGTGLAVVLAVAFQL